MKRIHRRSDAAADKWFAPRKEKFPEIREEMYRLGYFEGYRQALEDAANAVWANRWEPPYEIESRSVEAIRALADQEEA